MKDYAIELTASRTGIDEKLNVMREYLQAYILRIMHDEGVFRRCAFVGGTALRFLHNVPRYSEDIDFSLVNKDGYSFIDILEKVKKELTLSGYQISISYNDRKPVHSASIKFNNLLYEAGITTDPRQKFAVKLEVDTNPPAGAILETKIVNKYFPIAFLAHDLTSLFAGKLNALLSRKYTKGRDFFDLGWYLSRWPNIEPIIKLLVNGLAQTGWKNEMPEEDTWRTMLYRMVENVDWEMVHRDVVNFLDNPSDMKVFTKENVLKLIKPS